MSELFSVGGGELRMNFHAGQWRAWESKKRIVAIIAGSQSGKTEFSIPWLWREIKECGAGDYLYVGPYYTLLERKPIPAFRHFFSGIMKLGTLNESKSPRFVLSKEGEKRLWGAPQDRPTCVMFGHADNPDSLEAATAKGAVLDECGQKQFKVGSWEAIQRRLAINKGRSLLVTTPYNLGWLKQVIYDPWKKANENDPSGDSHPYIKVVQFPSTQNPAFSQEEYQRAMDSMPRWRFDMFHRGVFSRPAGQIYDCFDQALHVHSAKFIPPKDWPRFLGLDFGAINTAGVFLAQDPGGKFWAYKEYKAGSRTAAEHVKALLAGEPSVPMAVGGAKSEQNWRDEFAATGLYVKEPPVSEVEVGIDRVYSLFRGNRLSIGDDLIGMLDEVGTYSREVDDSGSPTEKIADKETFHHMDALRYVSSFVVQYAGTGDGFDLGPPSMVDRLPRGVFASDERNGYDVTDSRRWE